jgi:NADH:ubiquinone oxidoreductase subunit 4 (subunit M)
MLSILGVIYCALTAIRQIDIKRIIAYSSVSHMNLGVLGSVSFTMQGLEGFLFLMIGHGLVSTSLFLLVGSLYDRFHTKLIYYFGGLSQIMPVFSFFFFFFNIANFSFPGTSNFIGELLLLIGIVKSNIFIFLLVGFGILFGTCFSILLLNKVIFGTFKSSKINF